jgi:hypothetical protein
MGVALEAGRRGDGHDPAPAGGQHGRQHRPRHLGDGADVELVHGAERVPVGRQEGTGDGAAGVVDEDVDRAAGGGGGRHRVRPGDVDGLRAMGDAVAHRGIEPSGVAAPDRHVMARRGKSGRHRAADPASASRHQCPSAIRQGRASFRSVR